ncbi:MULTISPECIES: DUF2515 family protein [Neobacillus]|jgi:hypothetical protein|uniref:DUF2515 domain-containing protein n=1 Tax=Neobacillus sedimentimangrovi TaxID=2699460 RepID=A0ABS8QJA1_9BACI|nr:DUF2515 family protein [Neobacillus sedimentimangrovi]AIM15408.1 hypothetical protein HW35_03160 [Bacillus sp. X1(2014)]MCD4839321.1 DUF2515 domain-containing protein [Neobacillus sedimentimangrovi]
MNDLTIQEQNLIRQIRFETDKRNMDNISRTNAYFSYFKNNRDILWAFLASMVSRNGGWNMCDLEGSIFCELLAPEYRKQLFLVFERANWLIFHDVYPQLLIYQYSTEMKRPMFHLLPYFHVSSFIQKEWYKYWKEKDRFRLTTALIINEQNVIQTPVIDHPLLKKRVFQSLMFQFQDWLHFSCVLFPTMGGEVYGASVNGFRSLSKRINLGKRLANILFHPRLFPHFFEFAEKTSHTGSRNDYEQYFKVKTGIKTPILRMTYPIIEHHQNISNDWSKKRRVPSKWMKYPVKHRHPIHLTDWYIEKSNQLMLLLSFHKVFHLKKWE